MIKQFKSIVVIVVSFMFLQSCVSDDNDAPSVDKSKNLLPLGDSANDILSAANYSSILLEIVSVKGFEPEQASVNNLVSFMEARTFKPGGITVIQRSIDAPQNTPYTIQKVANVESANRTAYTNGDELAIFLILLNQDADNGSSEGVTLGAAYRNTSIALFESAIIDVSNQNSSLSKTTVETATLQHELGHILGLVDLGTTPQSDHLDEANGNHCDVSSCLMNFQIEFGSSSIMNSGTVPPLDAQCIADLQANGGR
jgi:hypothetical protein